MARLADLPKEGVHPAWRARDEESSGGLWVGEDLPSPQRIIRGKSDRGAIALPVASRCAGNKAKLRELARPWEQRDSLAPQHEAQPGTARHAECMPEDAEARHIGHRVDVRVPGELRADAVQGCHVADHVGV